MTYLSSFPNENYSLYDCSEFEDTILSRDTRTLPTYVSSSITMTSQFWADFGTLKVSISLAHTGGIYLVSFCLEVSRVSSPIDALTQQFMSPKVLVFLRIEAV